MAQAGPRHGLQRGGAETRVSITAHTPEPSEVRAYAEARLTRLQRHSRLHDASLLVDADVRRTPACSAELVVHLHRHVRLVATAEAATAQEAIDVVVDRADRQVLRRKDRVTRRKGHLGADGIAPATA